MNRLVAGCMTGTSVDGLDTALVEIEGRGLSMQAWFVRGISRPLGTLGDGLRQFAQQAPMSAADIAQLSHDFARLHAETVATLAGHDRLDLICVHGQTVYHAPPLSWQLFNPAPLVRALNVPVAFDLRAADLAAGGQGAPITPLADWVLFRRTASKLGPAPVAIVNLGGFVNITFLPRADTGSLPDEANLQAQVDQIEGRDVCICNQLLDALARELFAAPYDEDGRRAARGCTHDAAFEDLATALRAQSGPGRSLGTGDRVDGWLGRWRTEAPAEDLAATACAAIAQVVAEHVRGRPVVLAGGGIRNLALRHAIDLRSGSVGATASDDLGVPAAFREAACFAVLGGLCQDRVPITLPRITGVSSPAPLASCWMYP